MAMFTNQLAIICMFSSWLGDMVPVNPSRVLLRHGLIK